MLKNQTLRAVMSRTLLTVSAVAIAFSGALSNGLPAFASSISVGPFADSFDNARDADPHYGLNDSLINRQTSIVKGVTYTRVPGLSTPGDISGNPLRAWHSQVNHPNTNGQLSFHLRTSAVRLDAPLVNNGFLQTSATLTPVVGSNTLSDWSSIVLGDTSAAYGYPTNTNALGMLIRSNGKLEVFQYGKFLYNKTIAKSPNGVYNTTFRIDSNVNVSITVNGVVYRITLPKPVPAKPTLYLGRYSSATNTTSTVDNLSVSQVDTSALRVPPTSNLKYFGYFASRIESIPTNHVPDVRGFSNLNWVSISDASGYKPDELAECELQSCVLNTRWQFFVDCPGENCRLRDDAEQAWGQFIQEFLPYIDKIAAFALMDEAYWQGASYEDTARAADIIKSTFPATPVMLNFAAPSVDPAMKVPDSVDWVAFDQYCAPMATVEDTLKTIETATSERPDIKLFVYTESARNLCSATKTDAAVASLQWEYYNLALRHPRVVGILPFGLWTHEPTMAPLPQTIEAQQRIATRIFASDPLVP